MLYRIIEGTHNAAGEVEFSKKHVIVQNETLPDARKAFGVLKETHKYSNLLLVADLGAGNMFYARPTFHITALLDGEVVEVSTLVDRFIDVRLQNGKHRWNFINTESFCKFWDDFEEKGGTAYVQYVRKDRRGRNSSETVLIPGERTNRKNNFVWCCYHHTTSIEGGIKNEV